MPEAQQADLSSLESIFYAAAPMSPGKLKQLLEKFGNIFVQIYAATEHPAFSMSLSKADHIINSPEDEKRLAAVGKITPGVEVLLMDDDGVPVARGEIGEMWMRSRSIIQGYYNQPEKTAEEFTDGWWKSGDMARMDNEGLLYIVDRKKDMIISGGFNVYATEVEAAINAHDAIFMSAVVGIPHEEWGEAVHAEVVLREGASIDEAELIASLKTQLGSYKTPKSITFVDQLPISAVGKVLRKDVRQKYWKGSDRMIG
jgi:acyl-CoA synthetase (AMP-forming)/AMP-acid ligase II